MKFIGNNKMKIHLTRVLRGTWHNLEEKKRVGSFIILVG